MFSPAARKPSLLRQKDRNQCGHGASASLDSSPTPLTSEPADSSFLSPSIPNRPATGTPAPWATRPSVTVRIPATKNSENGTGLHQTKPVYVGDFPRVLRDAQEELLHEAASGDKLFTGGMDKRAGLCWIICGNKLYIWSYLSASLSNKCVILDIPFSVIEIRERNTKARHSNHLLVCIVRWDVNSASSGKMLGQCNSAGVIICNMRTQALVYWSDIFLESRNKPVYDLPAILDLDETDFHEGRKDDNDHQEICLVGSVYLSEHDHINSIIAAPVSDSSKECIAIACQSSGKLWHFHLTPTGIYRKKVRHDIFGASYASQTNKSYARSLIWHLQPHAGSEIPGWQFFLLTDREVQYWNVMLTPDVNVVKLWSHEIVGSDGDLGIKKDLAGQKHIWLLDMQVDERGKEINILVATFCKDRLGGSSYTQYSLLTMIYKAGKNFNIENPGAMSARVLEKKSPIQVIIPKARVVDEDFLFSMRLRVGGKPSGSAIILSGDGTATVTNYVRGCIQLYQFDLPYDTGKVLDASVFPSAEDDEEGAWVVLTEKVGVWAIPEKAVLLGGVEPPERSLSRKGSCNEGITQEEKRIQAFGGNMAPRRASSEAWSSGDRPRAAITGIVQRTAQDEETEVLLGRLFCDFMISGEVEGAFEKLRIKGAFEKEGETNVFARMSKSIVDTLAKHWTTTRGAELVASAIVSSLLLDKQEKHQKYLHFLALTGCHEELSFKQRHALMTIMEHGEKLSSMIQLRELQNMISQNCSNDDDSPSFNSESQGQLGGSLWDLIQLVGDKARRNTIMLMDRDNAEVFYSKVSDMDELFHCLSQHTTHIVGEDQPYNIQMQRAYEVSNACIVIIQASLQYRIEKQTWYPSPEGLIPWNCQPVVRSGLWYVAATILKLLKESALSEIPRKSDLWSQIDVLTDILLDAYTGSISTRIERGEEHRGLVQEYSRRRDELLDSLLELNKRFADSIYQDKCKGIEDVEAKETIYREVSLPLLAIAKRHEGYPTLWHICYQLNDSELLKNLMHDSRGPKGGFCNFVFEQLIKNCQYAKLLRLGEEFRDELASFLKDNNDLLWLHEIYLSRFSSASKTLHTLALSQDDCSALIEEQEFMHSKMPSSTADRRRLLNLSKIAVAAGKEEGFESKMLGLEADLYILKLQEEVVACFPFPENELEGKSEMKKQQLLPPAVLIELCLRGASRKLALAAFEIFAWTSSSFRSSNRSLLEECWRYAADQDDWVGLASAPGAQGWSDELLLRKLGETILFKASYRCYGPEAETYQGSFNEVLPLLHKDDDDADFTNSASSSSSVDTILMQHRHFPDAGKLMLTAIMMGKEGLNNILPYAEGELAMES